MRRSIERLLRANAFTCATFASAEELLLSGVAEGALALVLDLHLGGMSGIELRRRLQAEGSRVPVVFVTADEDEALHAEARAAGCIDCLQKPFEASRLTEALEKARRS